MYEFSFFIKELTKCNINNMITKRLRILDEKVWSNFASKHLIKLISSHITIHLEIYATRTSALWHVKIYKLSP